MKTWIDWLNRSAGEMLFSGGYVATQGTLAAVRDGQGMEEASHGAARAPEEARLSAPSFLAAADT
jgi:hypothetical protein